MGKHEFKGAEIIDHDAAEGGYFTRMFGKNGERKWLPLCDRVAVRKPRQTRQTGP